MGGRQGRTSITEVVVGDCFRMTLRNAAWVDFQVHSSCAYILIFGPLPGSTVP